MKKGFLDIDKRNGLSKEWIILTRRVHFLIPAFWMVFVFALWQALNMGWQQQAHIIKEVILFMVFLALEALIFLEWFYSIFYLTDQRVILRCGFLWKRLQAIPLGKIQNVSYRLGIWGKILEMGNLTVESAGQKYGVLVFRNITDPGSVCRQIQEEIGRHNNNPSP